MESVLYFRVQEERESYFLAFSCKHSYQSQQPSEKAPWLVTFLVLFSRTQAGTLVLVITITVLVWQSLEKDEGCLRTVLLPHRVQHISSPAWLSFESCSVGKTSRKVSVHGWGWSLHSHSVWVCVYAVCVCAHVFMCAQEQRLEDSCRCHPSVTNHLVLWDKVSHWLGVCPLGCFGQPASLSYPVCLSLSPVLD